MLSVAAGVALLLLLLPDTFLTVFHAQGRAGPVTHRQNRLTRARDLSWALPVQLQRIVDLEQRRPPTLTDDLTATLLTLVVMRVVYAARREWQIRRGEFPSILPEFAALVRAAAPLISGAGGASAR